MTNLKDLLHYDSVTGLFTWKIRKRRVALGAVAGTNCEGRIEIRIDGRRYKAHRLAWLYVHGAWPKGEIDHIDRNPMNNAISNLRDVTHKQNLENTGIRADNKSGIKGVSWCKRDKRWRAAISHNNKTIHLGNFTNKDDAAIAYQNACRKLFTIHSDLGVDISNTI